jgi:predicted GNAT family acetyltransferase
MFRKSAQPKQQVTNGRFEIEEEGRTAFLEYNLAGNVLQLIHTEVPPELQGKGVGIELAKSALDWARESGTKVDVVCELVAAYIKRHPEYADLVLR